jgi:hypothetical protein
MNTKVKKKKKVKSEANVVTGCGGYRAVRC